VKVKRVGTKKQIEGQKQNNGRMMTNYIGIDITTDYFDNAYDFHYWKNKVKLSWFPTHIVIISHFTIFFAFLIILNQKVVQQYPS
jgi:hypothetical protein